ncbi:MAG: hypothetical protein ABI076_04930 [Acidobacteriaceae bacterium]
MSDFACYRQCAFRVNRHANALGLTEKRKRNVRAALERIFEKAGKWT